MQCAADHFVSWSEKNQQAENDVPSVYSNDTMYQVLFLFRGYEDLTKKLSVPNYVGLTLCHSKVDLTTFYKHKNNNSK